MRRSLFSERRFKTAQPYLNVKESFSVRFSLLLELARRDFSERYAGSVLGMLWALLLPLVMIFIYTVIFSRVMGAKLPGI